MARGYFITGTDTGVGKTWGSLALMAWLQQQGQCVVGMKPVASGSTLIDGRLCNDDALLLQAQGSVLLPYAQVNPYAFAPAIAPHLAADEAGQAIALAPLAEGLAHLSALADQVIVEGAGGWRVPLNEREDMADLARELGLPVILVVGLRLGCINHALLSAEAIRASGCVLAGWIANTLDPAMPCLRENIDSIAARIQAPLLGNLAHQDTLNITALAQGIKLATIDHC